MPDQDLSFTQLPTSTYAGFNLPQQEPQKDLTSLTEQWQTADMLGPTADEYAQSISSGQSITDVIANIERSQDQIQDYIDNYPSAKFDYKGIGFNANNAHSRLTEELSPSTPTLQATNKPLPLGTTSQYNRYAQSEDFQTFGFTGASDEQEYKYGRAMTWGDTIAKSLGGASSLAWDTFVEGWKGWGRMADALFSWDASKLMGTPEEQYEMAQRQEDIMNKYAIYDTETSKDSVWNRQFFGTMLQQSGFAIGAGLQFAMEEVLTAGLATYIEPALAGSKFLSLGRVAKATERTSELINDTRKVMETVTSSERVTNTLGNLARKVVPMYGTVQDFVKLQKNGAGILQLAMTGMGGIKRTFSEFNMARSEAIFETAGTYKQMVDDLVAEYTANNGMPPDDKALEKIKQSAENAAHDNFWVNMGVLSVMNRIQFDNMFKGFGTTRKIFNEEATSLADKAFKVTGKIGEKTETRVFKKGLLGELSATGEIAKTFGKKEAAWQAAKSLGKGLMKFEGSEGAQELIQNASDQGLRSYYTDLYHGKKGYTGELDAIVSSIQNPLTDMEGMKTFLMGALTGRIISPFGAIWERTATRKDFKLKNAQADEAIGMLNSFYSNPSNFKKEWIANIKVQNAAASGMEEAAKNHNQYVFNNYKDSGFAKAVASAIKLDMFDSMRDVIKGFGDNLEDEEFQKAFDIDPTKENRGKVKDLMKEVSSQMEDYYTTFYNLKDKYGDVILPELFKYNPPETRAHMQVAKMALEDAIETLATNVFKSRQAVKRASQLQTEIGSNKNIGASSIEVLTKMGSQQATDEHIKILEQEIKQFETAGVPLTPDQKALLKNKKEELGLAVRWKSAYEDIIANRDESYSPTTEGRAYTAYADLVNLFNKNAKNTAAVSKQDVDDMFIKISDYITLNKDNKDYVDAMNFLADPTNIKLLSTKNQEAINALADIFKKEHKAEIREAAGKKGEVDEEDLKQDLKEKKEAAEKGTAPQPATRIYEEELEKHLQETYNKVKAANQEAGLEEQTPDYETWKETTGKFEEERFKRQWDKEKEEAKPKGTTKKEEPKAAQKGKYLVDGVGMDVFDRSEKDGVIQIKFIMPSENAMETEEESNMRFFTVFYNKKTKIFTDEQGKQIVVKENPDAVAKEEQPKPVTEDEKKAERIKELKYAIDQLEKGIEDRVKDFVSKGATEEEARNLALKELPELDRKALEQPIQSEIEVQKADIERRRQEELNQQTDAGYSTIALDYLFTGGRDVMLSTDYLLQALVGGFTSAAKEINDIRNKYANKLGNIRDDINSDVYNQMMGEIRNVISKTYNDSKANEIFDKILKNATGFTNREGNQISIELDKLNEQNESKINAKYDAELKALEKLKAELDTLQGVKPEPKKASLIALQQLQKAIRENYDIKDTIKRVKDAKDIVDAFDWIMGEFPKAMIDDFLQGKFTGRDRFFEEVNKKIKALSPEEEETTTNDVPDYAQKNTRTIKAQMDSDAKYAEKEYQEGYRQVEPSQSLANRTDNLKVDETPTTVVYTRTDVNKKYVFEVATPNFTVGSELQFKVLTEQDEYDELGTNRLTGEKYDRSKIFDDNGQVKPEMLDEVPIGVYATVNGKLVKIGHVHEPLWIEYRIGSKYPHIAIPEGANEREHIDAELRKNRDLRRGIINEFNNNPKAVITGRVIDKSNGILKTQVDEGLLKDRINPLVGEGGIDNRHGYFAIVRDGILQTYKNVEAKDVVETKAFTEDAGKYSGIPALLIPTPTGMFMPTFIGIPKLDKGKAEFLVEAWKAFTGKTTNPELVNAVYESLGFPKPVSPEIGVLRTYIEQYITALDSKKISATGTGTDVDPGTARLNIFDDGNMSIEVMTKDGKWLDKTIRDEKDLPNDIIDLLTNLRTTIKFPDINNKNLVGINSEQKVNFLSMENGKLISRNLTYNQYIMEGATTFVEKGTDAKNEQGDWVYFANPVIQMNVDEVVNFDEVFEDGEKETPPSTTPTETVAEAAPDPDDVFSQLERMNEVDKMSDKDVKEESDKCSPFSDQ